MAVMKLQSIPQPLIEVLRGYAVLCSPRYLQFPATVSFAQVHGFLLNHLLLNSHFTVYPPSLQYQKIFWKWAIMRLEQMLQTDDDAIDERLYEHNISLMQIAPQNPDTRPPSPSFFTYIWPCDTGYETFTLRESRTIIESGTTGMTTWRASLVLAQYFMQHPDLIRGKSVLEFGSGIGLLGLVMAALQGSAPTGGRITLTDVNTHVLSRCDDNLALPCNQSSQHKNLMTQQLDWNDALQESRRPVFSDILEKASPELIIGADVAFDPSIIPGLIAALQQALERDSVHFAIIALTVRNEDTFADFLCQAENALAVEQIPYAADASAFSGYTLATDATDTDHERQVRIFRLRKMH